MQTEDLSAFIKETALKLGFDACGFASLEPFDSESSYLNAWIKEGYHAGMDYLTRYAETRKNPSFLMHGSKSAIMLLLNYYPSEVQNPECSLRISKYAYSIDYHDIFKKKLKEFQQILSIHIPDIQCRLFTDTAPVFEKALAQRAGLGWIGKNSCLINPKMGSFFFIGGMMINKELVYDSPINSKCGKCQLCVDSCPNHALSGSGSLDANKCISYLTIEHKGDFPEISESITICNCLFGCDHCQDVCPWNKRFAKSSGYQNFAINLFIQNSTNFEWYNLNENDFKIYFAKSPLKRCGYKGIIRNMNKINKKKM